ncbi:MAG: ABC transporter permease subunit, partial [Coriobacteriia bacterium]|nr:ABC transporter permease subunit [Coriobacteriia bacterium]
VIVALGLIFFTLRYTPLIYGTVIVLALAHAVRFMPQSMQATAASLTQVPPRVDEAARIAGLSPFRVVTGVITRLVAPGLLAGAALVFVSSAKELPATLLLRPPGFDTLAVRVWVEAAEGAYHLAAPAALLMVALSIVPLKFMLDRPEV